MAEDAAAKSKITATEAVYFTGNADEVYNAKYATKDAIQAKAEKGKKLFEIHTNKKDPGKEMLTAAKDKLKPTRTFTAADLQEMRYSFGAGRVRLELADPTNPQSAMQEVVSNESMTAIQISTAEAAYKEGNELLQGVSDFLFYTDVLAETAKRKGARPDAVLADLQKNNPNRFPNNRSYEDMRNNALQILGKSDAIRGLLPEIAELTEKEQQDYLEKLLTSDPRMRQKVLEKADAIRKELRDLPSTKNEKSTGTPRTKEDLELAMDDRIDNITNFLIAEGLAPKDIDKLKLDIKSKLTTGMSTDSIIRHLEIGVRATDDIFKDFDDKASKEVELLQLTALEQKLLNQNKPSSNLGNVQSAIAKAKSELSSIESTITADPDHATKKLRWEAIPRIVSEISRREFPELIQTQQDYLNLIKDAKNISVNQKRGLRDSINDRLEQEREILGRMENVLAESAIEVIEDRYDDMAAAQVEFDTQNMSDEQKAAIGRLKKKMARDSVIKYNMSLRRTYRDEAAVDRRNKDVRFAIYNGEDDAGVKKLLLRDMGMKKPDGSMYSEYEIKNLNLDALSDEQKKQLGEVYTTYAEEYKKRLFTDFFISRGIMDKYGFGKMSLKDHEWYLMQQHYGEYIDRTINSSHPAKQYEQELKEKGYEIDSKKKLLIFILSLFGIKALSEDADIAPSVSSIPPSAAVPATSPAPTA